MRTSITAANVGGIFFPHSRELGLDPDDTLSPGLLQKVVHAGARHRSFREAGEELAVLAEAAVSEERVRRATERSGAERVAQRDAAAEEWRKLPFPERDCSPTGQSPPVACVQVDGGRMQIRDGQAEQPAGHRGGRFWRETRAACLLSLASETHVEDPCPQLPEPFANFARMAKITREIKGAAGLRAAEASAEVPSSDEKPADEPLEIRPEEEAARPGRPKILVRSVVATRESWAAFGPLVAAAAWQRGFAAAPRKAFLGDGSAPIWTLWRNYFSHYTPILDFVHSATYIFRAACAGRSLDEAVTIYQRWAQLVWSGRVDEVIAELAVRQEELGPPRPDDAETSPRSVVAEALGYLRNQRPRMRYNEYRKQGLPITTAHIESTVKQINRRVKGTEKFWKSPGAEALLQLAADDLSETQPLAAYWRGRPHRASGRRHYQRR